jgi:enoyl-CoA hydratase/carnithine racemase
MTADEADRWGFYNRVVQPESLMNEAAAIARSLGTGPTFAHAMTKRALHEEWSMSIDDALESEARTQAVCMQTEDFARAYHAFIDKQTPTFVGR